MTEKYRHPRAGGRYQILKIAKSSGDLKDIDPEMVVYHDDSGQCYVRPKGEFFRVMIPVK